MTDPYSHKGRIGQLSCLFAAGFVVLSLCGEARAEEGLYFYDPESSISNYVALKDKVTAYLQKYGQFAFQPFSHIEDFEATLSKNPEATFLVSSWHFKLLGQVMQIDPVLVEQVGGKTSQKKILVVNPDIAKPDQLKGKRIASASKDVSTRDMLSHMIGASGAEIAQTTTLLRVPKDIDGLMSVALGVADAALSTESSFAKLGAINPAQFGRMKILVTSDNLPLPIVATTAHSTKNGGQDKLVSVLRDMRQSPEGLEILKMMGLDGFDVIDAKEKRNLR